MTFIGIIANQKEYEMIKKKLEKQSRQDTLNIILIHEANIQNLQNIRFDILIIHEKMSIRKHIKAFEKICQNLYGLLINFDKNKNLEIFNGHPMTVITYGLNHKCTVTASSIQEDSIMVALQREILTRRGTLQEMEEKRIERIEDLDVYGHMLLYILDVLYGKK